MSGLPSNYDAWRLAGPGDESEAIGEEDGQPCNRFPEPDEDAPRGYRPRRCTGTMKTDTCGCCVWCDTCGEYAE